MNSKHGTYRTPWNVFAPCALRALSCGKNSTRGGPSKISLSFTSAVGSDMSYDVGPLRPLGPILHPGRQGQNLAVSLYPDALGAPSPSVKVQMFSHLRTMGPPLTVKGLIAFKARSYYTCHRVQASRPTSPLRPLVSLPHLPGDRVDP